MTGTHGGLGTELPMNTPHLRAGSLAVLGLAAAALCFPRAAEAHQFSVSHFRAEVRGHELDVSIDLDALTAAALLPLDADGDLTLDLGEVRAGRAQLIEYLDTKLEFASREGEAGMWRACRPGPVAQPIEVVAMRIQFRRRYDCRDPVRSLRIRNGTFMEDVGGHIFAADVVIGERSEHLTFLPHHQNFQLGSVLNPLEVPPDVASGDPGQAQDPPRSPGGVFRDYVWQGMLHIWGGIDHVLFVLCLLLVVRRWRDLAVLVTSFTVAHSITLILGALDIVPLEQWLGAAVVESSIALSILYVALENLHLTRAKAQGAWVAQPRSRLLLTFLFGLIHGFGFSSVLRELGLPPDDLTTALLAFNLGVELGQLAIVLPAFPIVLALARRPDLLRDVVRIGSGYIAGIALLWFVERALGLSFMPF
ncbi:MAG: HupE/UreJ family protein [Myxococcota bacterium]